MWVHAGKCLAEYFDSVKSEGICAWIKAREMRQFVGLDPQANTPCAHIANSFHSPVNRWNIIRPHVIRTGFTSRAFFSTDFTFVTIVLKEYFIGSPSWLMDEKLLFMLLSMLKRDDLMFERIVSSSSSTFLFAPRSH